MAMTHADVTHCPNCRTEFVAGIAACSDCGGPLKSGELPRGRERLVDEDPLPTDAVPGAEYVPEPPDTLLGTFPGEHAELIAKSMALEGLASLLECDGVEQLRGPHEPPKAPLARKKPVHVYVAQARLADAQEIADSLAEADFIGDQWQDESAGEIDAEDDDDRTLDEAVYLRPAAEGVPSPEGTSIYLLVFAVITAIVAVFVFLL